MAKKKSSLSDHNLLIRIDERVKKIDKCLGNHLKHHFLITVAALSAAFMGTASLIVGLILLLIKSGVM